MTLDPKWVVAAVSFLIGILLFTPMLLRPDSTKTHSVKVVSWALIAFSAAVILFSLFPDSTANGVILGISLSGAGGLMMLIWWRGVAWTDEANRVAAMHREANDTLATARQAQLDLDTQRTDFNLTRVAASQKDNPLAETRVYRYRLATRPDVEIGVVTGSILKISFADVWVNSENTNMQMSRFYEGSISGTIRYHAAKRDPLTGDVLLDPGGHGPHDPVATDLAKQMGARTAVKAAAVLVTDPGELAHAPYNVKKLFHVAAVQGHIRPDGSQGGYVPVSNLGDCVTEVLAMADSAQLANVDIASIAFPLLGAGRAGNDPAESAETLVQAAILYLRTRQSRVKRVFFIAWTERALAACELALRRQKELEPLDGVSPAGSVATA